MAHYSGCFARMCRFIAVVWMGMIGVSAGQTISTFAGGSSGFADIGDGGPASAAAFSRLAGVFLDKAGNFYLVDSRHDRIRKIDRRGMISTVAGGGPGGQGTTDATVMGDGGAATLATFRSYGPWGVYVDGEGFIYIADRGHSRIRKVAGGTITTVAGGGGGDVDGKLAINVTLGGVYGVYVDSLSNMYIASGGRIRKVAPSGIISTVAGVPNDSGFSGDGGPATDARFQSPRGIFGDGSGNLFITDAGNHRIRKVDSFGIITTVAGNGTQGFSGDGGSATEASLKLLDGSDSFESASPVGVFVDRVGNLFISDVGNNRIRKVTPSGIITTVAGNGTADFSGDGGPATEASLWAPRGVTADGLGNIFIADTGNNVIRKVAVILNIGLVADLGTIPADGSAGSMIQAQILNSDGTVVSGDNATRVTFEILEGEGDLSPTRVTVGDGIAQTRLTSRTSGTITVQASAPDIGTATVSVIVKTSVSPELIRASDFNRDGKVEFADFLDFVPHFGKGSEDVDYESKFDLDGDQSVGFNDFLLFVQSFGQSVDSAE